MDSVSFSNLQTDAIPVKNQRDSSKSPENNESHKVTPPDLSSQTNDFFNAPSSAISFNNCSNIHLGNTVILKAAKTIVRGNEDDEINKFPMKKTMEKDTSVIQLMDSKEPLSTKYMILVSENLGKGWRTVFRNMGYTDGFIETMIESHKNEGISEVIYQILLDWTRNAEDGEQRSLAELSAILWNEGKCEVVQRLASLYKTINSKNSS